MDKLSLKSFDDFITEQELIAESYKNLFSGDIEEREKYVDQVWDMLQTVYAPIGGIKGSGFNSKEDMIKKIPMWKLNVVDGKVISVVMYKDKGGRKLVASGTDGSAKGLESARDSLSAELLRSFGEKSKRALGSSIKTLGADAGNFMISVPEASKILGKELIPVDQYLAAGNELSEDDQFTYEKYNEFAEFMYMRKIGGGYHLKIMFGTPGLKIV